MTDSPTSLNRWRPPSLRVKSSGEGIGHASWIELFFDLVFVVVVEQLGHYLSEHLTLTGFLQFAALAVPCWWAWTLFTFYLDRYEADDVLHRLLVLAGMLAIVFLSAAVHNAFSESGVAFVAAYLAIRTIVLMLYLRTTKYVAVAVANLRLYSASYIPSTVLWISSIAFEGIGRYTLWALAMAIELAVPILGSRLLVKTPVHPSHLPERFGLLTIIVLGESIVSVAVGTEGTHWQVIPLTAAIGGFAIAACLWWLYFSFFETVVKIRGIASVHLYNYGHFPIVLGLCTIAIGVGHTISEAAQPVLADGTRWALCGGIALYMVAIIAILTRACRRNITLLSVAVVGVALALAAFGGSLPPLAIEGILILMLAIKVYDNIRRSTPIAEHPTIASTEPQEVA